MSFVTVIGICFFLSGASSLIYEVIWVRLLTLTFGNTAYAVGIVLTAFMSGLSVGSFLLGRWADRRNNPVTIYGVLEICIAIFAVSSPLLLQAVTSAYLSLSPSTMPFWMISALRYLLSFAVLLFPAALMGGTLPVLSRYLIKSDSELGSRLGTLYTINTIGGVIGTFLVGFVLLRFIGLSATLKLTAFINLVVGGAACYMGTTKAHAIAPDPQPKEHSTSKKGWQTYALTAFFLSGFSSMAYEVVWTRLLANVIGSSTYAFSIILMGFLSGIGLGSLIAAYVSKYIRPGLVHFSSIQIMIGIFGFSTIFFFNLLPPFMLQALQLTHQSYGILLVLEFLLVFLYLLVPTTLFGATLPVIAAAQSAGPGGYGKDIGNIYSANTVGCALGAALAGFLLLPELGSVTSIKITAAINIFLGISGIAVIGKHKTAVALLTLLFIPLLPADIHDELMDSGVGISAYGKLENSKDRFRLYLNEGRNATVSVVAYDDGQISLRTNGKTDAATGQDMSTQLGLGYFPLLLHPNPRNILVIGFGTGVTVKTVADYPGTSVDCVEIEPAILDAAGYFVKVNDGVRHRSNVSYFIDDARSYIAATNKKYDLIISEPSNPWISGIGSLFSLEFYKEAALKLTKGGIFCQWVQLYQLGTNDLKMIIKTFSLVFPETTVWQSSGGDILLMGSGEPLSGFDLKNIAGKLSGKMAWELKSYLNIEDPMDFFSYFITGKEGITALSDGAQVNTDDLPLLEFSAPLSLYDDRLITLNNEFLFSNIRFPSINTGEAGKDTVAELLYRKSVNHIKLNYICDRSWIEKALAMSPRNTDYLVQHAKTLSAEGKISDAEKDLKDILRTAPRNPAANFEMALLLAKTGGQDASVYMEKAVALKSDDFEVLYAAGQFMLSDGRYDEAIHCFLKALQLPHRAFDTGNICRYLGMAYIQSNNYDEAIIYFKRSLEENPYNAETQLSLADLYLSMGKKDDACGLYENALKFSRDETLIKSKISKWCSKT